MGSDPMAVVDAQLRVHGIAGLRVADASIMPTLTSGNTNAPSIMIGEEGRRHDAEYRSLTIIGRKRSVSSHLALRRILANVSFLNPLPAFSHVGANRSSCR